MASGPSGDGAPNSADIPRGLVNRTGNPIGRGSRLPSVRGHRDLTLGGIQKKIFKPNLAAVKKATSKEELPKQDVSPAASSNSGKYEDSRGGRSERGRGRGRGRGHFEDRTIQLQSEFAFGPMGKSSQASGGWSRGSGGGGSGGGGGGGGGSGGRNSDGDLTTLKASMKFSKDTDDDSKLFDKLMRDDFISDLSSGDPHMAPVQLPLNLNRTGMELKVKPEVKEEVMDLDQVNFKAEVQQVSPSHAGHSMPSQPPSNVKDIFNISTKSEKGELLFLQFPDTLPGLPASSSDDSTKSSTTSTADAKEDELIKRLSSCQLKDCNEGYMGKLRIYQSGKAQLVLGDNIMDVLPGIPINFHQELVSIHTDDNAGQLIVLGPVSHKLVVTPNYNDLLSHISHF